MITNIQLRKWMVPSSTAIKIEESGERHMQEISLLLSNPSVFDLLL